MSDDTSGASLRALRDHAFMNPHKTQEIAIQPRTQARRSQKEIVHIHKIRVVAGSSSPPPPSALRSSLSSPWHTSQMSISGVSLHDDGPCVAKIIRAQPEWVSICLSARKTKGAGDTQKKKDMPTRSCFSVMYREFPTRPSLSHDGCSTSVAPDLA